MSDLGALGWDERWAARVADRRGVPGRVVRQDRGWVLVDTGAVTERVRTRADRSVAPVAGDWVLVVADEVVDVLERRNVLRRADPVGEGSQVLAANLDTVLVVAGLDRPVKEGRIQRALVQVHDAGAEAVVVLTKADLSVDADAAGHRVSARHPGVDVAVVSVVSRAGLAGLAARIRGRTVLMLGESGAGKSSLLNALAGADLTSTAAVRGADAKGRHTTTRRSLHRLPDGALVVDTPGIRALGVYADPAAVDAAFPDVLALAESCRFRDCSHGREPGCAVLAAVEAGTLRRERLELHRELHAESAWAQLPEHERRARRR